MSSSEQQSPRLRPAYAVLFLLPGTLFAIWYAYGAYRLAGTLGFPLDDSWIHAQFARNVATGLGFTYTGGQWVSGSTAPAWTLLLAAGFFVTRDAVASALLMGIVTQFISGLYAARLAHLLGTPLLPALLAGTFVVIMPAVTWGAVSGMEVPLATALVLAGVYHHFAGRHAEGPRRYLGAALLGASALARPENLVIAGLVLGSELISRSPFAARVKAIAIGTAAAAALFAPLVLFSYATIGRPLPTTFYAKSGPGIVRAIETRDAPMAERNLTRYGPLAVKNFGLILQDQFSWGAWLLAPAALALFAGAHRRVSLTLVIVLLVVPYVMGLTAPQRLKPENVRYAAQLVVLVAPLVVAGIWSLVRVRPLAWLVVVVAIGLTGWRTAKYLPLYATSVKNIQEIHVKTGRWLAANRPEDDVVAVNDVGAIAYFSGRRILDLEGLVSPEVLPYRVFHDRGLRVVMDMKPDVLAIFPHWYPEIAASPAFREIHRVGVTDNVVSAGDTMIVYEPAWSSVGMER